MHNFYVICELVNLLLKLVLSCEKWALKWWPPCTHLSYSITSSGVSHPSSTSISSSFIIFSINPFLLCLYQFGFHILVLSVASLFLQFGPFNCVALAYSIFAPYLSSSSPLVVFSLCLMEMNFHIYLTTWLRNFP